jgi:Tfp pilus assembly protein PilF
MLTHAHLALTLVCLLTLNTPAQTPKAAVSYCQRGVEEFQKGDLDAAIADFTTAVTFDPGYPRAYLNRAIVRCRKGQLDEALKDFNKTIELKPDSADAYSGRGSVYIDLGEYDRAVADFSRAIAINTLRLTATAG